MSLNTCKKGFSGGELFFNSRRTCRACAKTLSPYWRAKTRISYLDLNGLSPFSTRWIEPLRKSLIESRCCYWLKAMTNRPSNNQKKGGNELDGDITTTLLDNNPWSHSWWIKDQPSSQSKRRDKEPPSCQGTYRQGCCIDSLLRWPGFREYILSLLVLWGLPFHGHGWFHCVPVWMSLDPYLSSLHSCFVMKVSKSWYGGFTRHE